MKQKNKQYYDEILKNKSDFFWESLQQHIAERIFGNYITDPIYLFGPGGIENIHEWDESPQNVKKSGSNTIFKEVDFIEMKIIVDPTTDPINPQPFT